MYTWYTIYPNTLLLFYKIFFLNNFSVYRLFIPYTIYTFVLIMAKKTVSFKLEEDYRLALEKEARKKEWTLSYFIQSIVNQHVKKNKLV